MAHTNNDGVMPILSSPYKHDVPRAFSVSNKYVLTPLCGPYAKTIANFARYQHFDLQLDRIDDIGISEVYAGLEEKKYNISLHGSPAARPVPGVMFSYPVEWMRNCIMVPLEDEIPKYLYVVWPFDRYIWLTGFLGAIYISFLMRYIEHPRRGVTRSVVRNMLHSMSILLYSSNMNVRLRNAHTRALVFYSLLLALGFILSAYHSPYLTAYDMKPIFVEPINTIEDLLDSEIEVLIPDDEFIELSESSYVDLTPIQSLIRSTSRQEFSNNLEGLNRTFAYFISQDQWNFIHKQQRILKKPYFHLSRICYGSVFNSYPMQANSTFEKELNLFTIKIKEAGLWSFWEEQAFNMAVIAGYARVLLDTYPVEPLNLDFFRLGWMLLAIGFPLSFIAFFAEIYLKKQKFWGLRKQSY